MYANYLKLLKLFHHNSRHEQKYTQTHTQNCRQNLLDCVTKENDRFGGKESNNDIFLSLLFRFTVIFFCLSFSVHENV